MKYLVVLVLLGGCSLDRETSDWPAQTQSDAGMDVTAGVDGGLGQGPGAGTMDGSWLMIHEGSTCVLNVEQLTHSWYVVDIEQKDRVLSESHRFCRIDLSPVLGQQVIIPQKVVDAISVKPIDRGYVADLRVGGSYSSSTELALWGLDLDDPIEGMIPADASDPQVVDSDNDGQPAVTFEVENSTCRRFQAQRQFIRYTGEFVAPNAIEGSSVNLTDLKVYGSTEALCGIAPPVVANDDFSRFRMVRVDGAGGSIDLDADGDGRVSCQEAADVFEQLIERRQANDDNCRP